ncbi:3394_t:CDS:2 [Paraglomus brasilianum]|uniref:3394_t:CDS:1 n=1 Tax=Paraglomus brasilianum TaxID=144538 RepID=A0A9N9ARQ1_9GLOM|nr:3394_t:CDS:2 [Paraglomus brasilianum]
MFKPHAWGRNTFVLHILCEGHFTGHPGYKMFDPKPFLAKTGPIPLYPGHSHRLSYICFFTRMQFPDTVASIIADIAASQWTTSNGCAKLWLCHAMRELEAFLAANDPLHEFGGLYRVTMSDGRWIWICTGCSERA